MKVGKEVDYRNDYSKKNNPKYPFRVFPIPWFGLNIPWLSPVFLITFISSCHSQSAGNLNVMGTVKYVLTFLPLCVPGVKLGNRLTTCNASRSR